MGLLALGLPLSKTNVSAGTIASLTLTNTIASTRNDRVELFGHAFARGDVPSGQTLQAEISGSPVPLQTMRTTTWPDSSLQFAVFAVAAGDFTASQSKTVDLSTGGSAPSGSDITLSDLPTDGNSDADLTLDSETITCNRTNLQGAGSELVQVFTGPHCAHWVYRPAYSSPSRVYARFDIYAFRTATSGAVDRVEYAGGNEVIQIRLDESDHGTVSSAVNRFRVDSVSVLNETVALYQYSRWWEHDFDLDIHVIHDIDYLASTGVIWSYLDTFTVSAGVISGYASDYSSNDGINETGGWRTNWSEGGTDPEIGPIPGQDVCYLISQNAGLRDTVLRMHQRQGRHQFHMWDEDQGRPAQVGPGAAQHNTGNVNMNPEFDNNAGFWGTFAEAPWSGSSGTDVSHMPRGGFVPYLISGRDWYREEMVFFANMCCSNESGAYIDSSNYNILSIDQLRAEGWGLCQVAVAAALSPDGDAMKAHFEGALARHLSYTWDDNLAPDATPGGSSPFGWNQLGMVRNTPWLADFAREPDFWVPWMQDFMTIGSVWAWKLGFDGTGSLADYSEYSRWLCKNTVGKINKFGWQSAALYWTTLRNGTFDHQYWHTLRDDLYDYNEGNSEAFRPDVDDGGALVPFDDTAELQTGEPGSLSWRNAFLTNLGTTDSVGYTTEPASDIMILWAAISACVDRGAAGATEARTDYIQIGNKPDTAGEPQYEIVPTSGFPHTTDGPGDWIQDNVPTDSTWQQVTSNLERNLDIQASEPMAYSGGGCGGGRIFVFGGGHNNGMNDATAILDLRRLDTLGYINEVNSTADHEGAADDAYNTLGTYLNGLYDTGIARGGIRDSRGLVPLSRHTYDGVGVTEDGVIYMYGGILPYDNSGQPSAAWANRENDMWKYTPGVGWEYLAGRGNDTAHGTCSVAIDTLDSDRIWVRDSDGIKPFNLTNNTFGSVVDNGGVWGEESFMNFNEDDGVEGTLACGGSYGGANWNEYDIEDDSWSANRSFPSGADTDSSYVFHVAARHGANYGTYFCFAPNQGTLYRWSGSDWSSIATGGPTPNDLTYGRCGFDEVHQVFYVVVYSSGYQTWLVRPYAYG